MAEVSLGYDKNGQRKRIRRKAKTKTAVREKLRLAQRQAEDGLPTGRANMTVAELLDQFTESVVKSQGLSPDTVERYAWAIEGGD